MIDTTMKTDIKLGCIYEALVGGLRIEVLVVKSWASRASWSNVIREIHWDGMTNDARICTGLKRIQFLT